MSHLHQIHDSDSHTATFNHLTQNDGEQPHLFQALPPRILQHVLSFLTPVFFPTFRRINRRIKSLSQLPIFWKELNMNWVSRITTLKDLRQFVDAFVGPAKGHVQSLVISSQVAVNASSIPSLLRSLPSLVSLKIDNHVSNWALTPKHISDKALTAFAQSPYLRELYLPDQSRISSQGVIRFINAMKDKDQLQSLDLTGSNVTNECLTPLLSLPSLKKLKLGNTSCGIFEQLETNNSTLTELEVYMSSIEFLKQFSNIATAKCKCKKGLDQLGKTIESLDRLVNLDVMFDNQEDDNKQVLQDNIYSSSLQSLSMQNINIKTTNFRCFTLRKMCFENCSLNWERSVFEECPNVEHLELIKCTFYDSIDLNNALSQLRNLKTLKITYCRNLPLKQLSIDSLENIELTNNSAAPNLHLNVSGKKIKQLVIQRFEDISTLNIDCPNASDVSIMNSEMDGFNTPNIEEFSIHSDKITNLNLNRCLKLKHVSVDCPCLTSLNVAESKSLETFNVFARSLSKLAIGSPKFVNYEWFTTLKERSPSISMLFLGGSGDNQDPEISNSGVNDLLLSQICELWNTSLQAIIVAHNENVKEPKVSCNIKGIQFIACQSLTGIQIGNCPELFNIFINQCPKIESEKIDQAAQQCPKLSNIKITGCVNLEQFVLNGSTVKKIELIKNTALGSVKLADMNRLETLIFEANTSLEHVQCNLPRQQTLKSVTFRQCQKLSDECLEEFTQSCNNIKFGEFSVYHCEKITMPRLHFPCGAEKMVLGSLSNLNYPIVQGEVQSLTIESCHTTNWVSLYNMFPKNSNIIEMHLSDCPNISGLNVDDGIETLSVSSCFSLGQIKLYSGTGLESITLNDLSALQVIGLTSAGRIDTPVNMNIDKCPKLRLIVGTIPQLLRIRNLNIADCKSFTEKGIQFLQSQSTPPEHVSIANTLIKNWPPEIPVKSVDVKSYQENENTNNEMPPAKLRMSNSGERISSGGG